MSLLVLIRASELVVDVFWLCAHFHMKVNVFSLHHWVMLYLLLIRDLFSPCLHIVSKITVLDSMWMRCMWKHVQRPGSSWNTLSHSKNKRERLILALIYQINTLIKADSHVMCVSEHLISITEKSRLMQENESITGEKLRNNLLVLSIHSHLLCDSRSTEHD